MADEVATLSREILSRWDNHGMGSVGFWVSDVLSGTRKSGFSGRKRWPFRRSRPHPPAGGGLGATTRFAPPDDGSPFQRPPPSSVAAIAGARMGCARCGRASASMIGTGRSVRAATSPGWPRLARHNALRAARRRRPVPGAPRPLSVAATAAVAELALRSSPYRVWRRSNTKWPRRYQPWITLDNAARPLRCPPPTPHHDRTFTISPPSSVRRSFFGPSA